MAHAKAVAEGGELLDPVFLELGDKRIQDLVSDLFTVLPDEGHQVELTRYTCQHQLSLETEVMNAEIKLTLGSLFLSSVK